MTIPSRPAPAPPGSRAQNAAAGANASLEQLRLQLQQQHQQQQQAGNGLQKLTIKLPPPPKGPAATKWSQKQSQSNINNNMSCFGEDPATGKAITRKFPQARYTPATNWEDSAFGGVSNGNGNNFRKVPPPRPPPPKVQVNGQKLTSSAAGGGSLITNIFNRKKTTTTAASKVVAAQNRVYGLSSGHGAAAPTNSATNSNYDWNAAWNTTATVSASTSHFASSTIKESTSTSAEGQLISFDSPPSSPTFTQKSNSDCVSVDSFSSDSNFSSPNNGSVSQPESGFEDDYQGRSRPATNSPLDPWEALDNYQVENNIGLAPVRQLQQQQQSTRSLDNPLCNGKSLLPPTQSLPMPTIIKPKISQKPKAPKPPPFLSQPPMFAPPAPPSGSKGAAPNPTNISLLDVISGKVDAMALSNGCNGYLEEEEVPYAIALYDFEGVEEGDLNFRENEKIYLLDQPTEEWFRGRTRAGCEGIFPVNFVEVKVPLGSGENVDSGAASQGSQFTVRCLYHFPGEVAGDLELQENELVTVLYRINEDWLFGEVAGHQGQFPANFLEYVPENLPTA